MIKQLPILLPLLFGLTTMLTLFLFYRVLRQSTLPSTGENASKILLGLTGWLLLQGILSLLNVYNSNNGLAPPRIFLFGILPTFIAVLLVFVTKKGRRFIDSLSLQHYTQLHVVRIPVEFVLWWLFLNKCVPELMTFEGRNFDILAGISAPFIAFFGFRNEKVHKSLLIVWNFICLALLINIAIHGFLSAPSPLQKLAFEQPNIALLYFPFSWLVSFVVPIVLFGHLTALRQLLFVK